MPTMTTLPAVTPLAALAALAALAFALTVEAAKRKDRRLSHAPY
jgi:hypothetical protein